MFEDFLQGFLGDGVKGFPKVEFYDHGLGFPFVAAVKELGCVDEIFGYASSRDEARLVCMDK
jgi:hypothetical protein